MQSGRRLRRRRARGGAVSVRTRRRRLRSATGVFPDTGEDRRVGSSDARGSSDKNNKFRLIVKDSPGIWGPGCLVIRRASLPRALYSVLLAPCSLSCAPCSVPHAPCHQSKHKYLSANGLYFNRWQHHRADPQSSRISHLP